MAQSRAWCFTIKNYSESELEIVKEVLRGEDVVYGVIGLEVAGTGTAHIQGFGYFSGRRRLGAVCRLLGGRAHCEVARCPRAAARYCKKGGDYIEFGNFDELPPELGDGVRGVVGTSRLELVTDQSKPVYAVDQLLPEIDHRLYKSLLLYIRSTTLWLLALGRRVGTWSKHAETCRYPGPRIATYHALHDGRVPIDERS
jgi:hypothetical protein